MNEIHDKLNAMRALIKGGEYTASQMFGLVADALEWLARRSPDAPAKTPISRRVYRWTSNPTKTLNACVESLSDFSLAGKPLDIFIFASITWHELCNFLFIYKEKPESCLRGELMGVPCEVYDERERLDSRSKWCLDHGMNVAVIAPPEPWPTATGSAQ